MNRHWNRASILFLLLLGILSQIRMIVESFGCVIEGSAYYWILALCLCVWIAACFSRGLLLGMPLSALILYAAYRYYDCDPAVQLADFFDRVAGAFYEHIYSPGNAFAYTESATSHSLILILLAFLLAAYLSSALTSRGGRILLSLLGSVPIFIGCLAVNGIPSVSIVVPMLLFWILLFVSGGSYLPDSGFGRTCFLLSIPAALLLCLLLLLCDPTKYHFTPQDVSLSHRIDQLLSGWSMRSAGEGTEVDIQVLEPIPAEETERPKPENAALRTGWGIMGADLYLNQPYNALAGAESVLQVTADTDGLLYLRIVSYGDYVGTGWLRAESFFPSSSLSYTSQAIASSSRREAHQVSIFTEKDLEYLAEPYYAQEDSRMDSYVPSAGQNYSISYWTCRDDVTALDVPKDLETEESAYALYARMTYTRLPENTRETMLSLCEANQLSADSPDIIQQVAAYVQNAGEYSLATSPYPSDDYATYFLTDARQGYCIHFATAATAMYRALGIPARLTEGFLCPVRADQTVSISGSDAHAWVEVYIEGLGWIPVEVTGRSTGGTGSGDGSDTEGDSASAGETDENAARTSPLPAGIVSQETMSESKITPAVRVLHCVLLVLAFALLSVAWYQSRRYLHRRRLFQEDSHKAAVYLWRCADSLREYGAAVPPEILQSAEKAAFSPHLVEQEELAHNRALFAATLEEVYSGLNPFQKCILKFVKGFL